MQIFVFLKSQNDLFPPSLVRNGWVGLVCNGWVGLVCMEVGFRIRRSRFLGRAISNPKRSLPTGLVKAYRHWIQTCSTYEEREKILGIRGAAFNVNMSWNPSSEAD